MTDFAERTWRAADGLVLSARDYAAAAGPARLPVIMLHGLTRNARDFEEVAPAAAAQGRRVLAVDVRGRGRSAWSPRPSDYTPLVYAADVEALMRAAGLARAVFVGASMGGLITMALAAGSPDLVAAAVLNDVGPELAPEGLARIVRDTAAAGPVADWPTAAATAARVHGPAFPRGDATHWDAFARRLYREDGEGRPVPDLDPAIGRALAEAPSGPAPDLWPLWERLAAGRRPLLLVRGALSDVLAPATAQRMAAVAPQLRRVEAPDVGHAPMLTEPAVADALRSFLEEVD